ncbi:glycine cleavage system aminomethyltransferase GcvT [candidate division KSB1 bacterium]|nr:glycine cleavage system aminomethyltransferase GcvT [candidate division KSB1 bacterium]
MSELKKTGFYDFHLALGAKIVPFGGFLMPVQYSSIMNEHRAVRARVGLFDVSHMGEFYVRGQNATQFLQKLTINDIEQIDINQAQYTAMCYPDGGIVDDLLIYRFADYFMMVVNASNTEKDWQWAQKNLLDKVKMENVTEETSLLALQGPLSTKVLAPLVDVDLKALDYYHFIKVSVGDVEAVISRTGYTGEIGYELYFSRSASVPVWEKIMQAGEKYNIEPVGLGARDTLRLEKKYCLYGNDIDNTTNPLEAGLGWITKFNKGEFIGRDALLQIKQSGIKRKLVGFEMLDKAVPRHGYKIFIDDKSAGVVTSGTFSPMLEKGIGMGYVPFGFSGIDTPVYIEIRGKLFPGKIVKTPFYDCEG